MSKGAYVLVMAFSWIAGFMCALMYIGRVRDMPPGVEVVADHECFVHRGILYYNATHMYDNRRWRIDVTCKDLSKHSVEFHAADENMSGAAEGSASTAPRN